MADSIGTLAYKVRFDASQLTKGLLSTRQQFSAARKLTEQMAAPLDRYSNGLSNIDGLLARGLITAKQATDAQRDLRHGFLESESTIRRLTKAENDEIKSLRSLSSQVKTTANDEAQRAKVMQRGREITEQARSAQDRLNRSLAEAKKLYREGAISAGTYSKHVADLKKNAGGGGMLAGVGKSALGMVGATVGIGSMLSVGKDAIAMTANVERAEAAMEAFTGSSAKAARMLDDIRRLSSLAGISFTQLNEGAAAMLSYGVTAEQTSKKLTQFAAISRGDSERFRSLALAFGQVNAAGRLMGQEVLQMVNAGFNPLQEIARTTGIEFSTLKKMMENGQVSIEMVSKAFDSATSAGGRFNGMLETIGEKSTGALGRLRAEWELFLNALGKSMPVTASSDAIAGSLSKATALISSQEEAVKQRMEQGKASKNAGLSVNMFGVTDMLHMAGQAAVYKAGAKSNALDDRIGKSNSRSKAHDEMLEKQKADRAQRQQQLQQGVESLRTQQQDSKLEQRKEANPVAFKQFERATSLMDETKKKQAAADFAQFGNINRILPLLDKELQIELAKLDAIERQNAARNGIQPQAQQQRQPTQPTVPTRQQMTQPLVQQTPALPSREEHERTRYRNQGEALAMDARITQLEMMRGPMGMGGTQQQPPMMGMQQQMQPIVQIDAAKLAPSLVKGTQEAYRQMIAGQVRADKSNSGKGQNAVADKIAEGRQTQLVSYTREMKDSLKEIADGLKFETIG